MNDNSDLIVTRADGSRHGYVLQTPTASMSTASYGKASSSLDHVKQAPNVPMNVGFTSPTQAGGQYDVRDSDGDKAIAHLDWSGGAGQESLDAENSLSNRYLSSSNIDVGVKGSIRLARRLEFSPVLNASGPIYSALGKYWMACEGGKVRYSTDGEEWVEAVLNDPTNGPIRNFTTDGESVYFCVGSGSYPGVWRSTSDVPVEFDRLNTSPLLAITYNSGMLFGATDSGAGHMDPSTHAYTEDTMAFLATNQTIELTSVGNTVYWVASQGGSTFIYSLVYNDTSSTVLTAEVTHLRSGFIGTCATGYLDGLYIGGYLDSFDENIGQGLVYLLRDGTTIPLTRIGPDPMVHPTYPLDVLDNRVYGMCAGGDKLYIQCNRGIYVWDIDDGGYHHFSEFFASLVGIPSGGNEEYDAFEAGAFEVTGFQTSSYVYETISNPGISYKSGMLLAPYIVASSFRDQIAFTNSQASPSVFTSTQHGLLVGQRIVITGSTSDASANGEWFVNTVPTSDTFTVKNCATGVALNCTVAGGSGTYQFNADRGAAKSGDKYAYSGEIVSSSTNFHTGSMEKGFFDITISHESMYAGTDILVSYKIDNGAWQPATLLEREDAFSRYNVNEQGYSIALRLTLQSVAGDFTPVIHAVNVSWNFLPVKRHNYSLDCRTGAAAGRWMENPETAISHLYLAADERCTFQDRFVGEYTGIIEKLDYEQATYSAKEGVSGLVHIVVRELA